MTNRDVVFEAKVRRLEQIILEVSPEIISKSMEEMNKHSFHSKVRTAKTFQELSLEREAFLQERLDATAQALIFDYRRRRIASVQ